MSDFIVWRGMMGARHRADGRKLTQKEASELLDLSTTTWNRYERGLATAPRHIRLAMSALLNGLPEFTLTTESPQT